jgi:hypothetical protein
MATASQQRGICSVQFLVGCPVVLGFVIVARQCAPACSAMYHSGYCCRLVCAFNDHQCTLYQSDTLTTTSITPRGKPNLEPTESDVLYPNDCRYVMRQLVRRRCR